MEKANSCGILGIILGVMALLLLLKLNISLIEQLESIEHNGLKGIFSVSSEQPKIILFIITISGILLSVLQLGMRVNKKLGLYSLIINILGLALNFVPVNTWNSIL